MAAVSAVSVSPTRTVPMIVGRPVAGGVDHPRPGQHHRVFRIGPYTVVVPALQ